MAQVACAAIFVAGIAAPAHAERLCDPSFEDCRTPLLNYIRSENVGIDVAFWFMQDARYQTEIPRWQASRSDSRRPAPTPPTYPGNEAVLNALAAAGIPMRMRKANAPGILHWKMMLFAGQSTVEFGGANYSPTAFVPEDPYRNYEDETPFFSDDPVVVNSFKTKYDDLWLDTTYYQNYANITNPLARVYPIYTKDPELNFPQQEDYAQRLLKRYPKETQKIDVIMYRVTDERHTNAMIAAQQRRVPVRIIGEIKEYRVPTGSGCHNMDKLWAAGVPHGVRAHAGLNHQEARDVLQPGAVGVRIVQLDDAVGEPAAGANYFTTKSWIFQWFIDHFERKWNNTSPVGAIETRRHAAAARQAGRGLAGDGAVSAPLSVALTWTAAVGARLRHLLRTDPEPAAVRGQRQAGPNDPDQPVFRKSSCRCCSTARPTTGA
jgi:hypothetical protein